MILSRHCSASLYAGHVFARLLCGSGLLFVAVTLSSIWSALALSALAAGMLRLLSGNWQLCLRIMRLLRWFMIPILLLHALFTPGQLLLPGMIPLLSMEGLRQGVWLSVHLLSIYTTALLLFHLLYRREWLSLLSRWPWGGQLLAMRLWMVMAMQRHIFSLLSALRQQYRMRQDWKRSALMFIAAFRQSLATATDQAGLLWLRWPQQVPLGVAETALVSPLHRGASSVLLSTTGCISLMIPWLA